ncbi:SH3 domain-containing protein [Roseibium sp. MB-4]
MLNRFAMALAAAVLTMTPALAQSGGPAIAYTTANLNMRAGPGTNYPVLTTLPQGAGVTVFGCTADFQWCDAAFTSVKGWVSGKYLSYGVQGRYYGQPIPRSGIYVGVPRYQRNYPVYGRGPVRVQPLPGYRRY